MQSPREYLHMRLHRIRYLDERLSRVRHIQSTIQRDPEIIGHHQQQLLDRCHEVMDLIRKKLVTTQKEICWEYRENLYQSAERLAEAATGYLPASNDAYFDQSKVTHIDSYEGGAE